MIPKIGDVVRLNPEFLKVWFRRGNRYFGEEVWKEKFEITEVDNGFIKNEIVIKIEYKDFKYYVFIFSNGELSTCNEKYRGIQVFIPANPETKKNNIYCSCNGPKKENCVLGKKFYVCTVCKKEKIQ